MYRSEVALMVANTRGRELRREARDARRSRRPALRPAVHQQRTIRNRPITLRRPVR